jgi:hypothetical protein
MYGLVADTYTRRTAVKFEVRLLVTASRRALRRTSSRERRRVESAPAATTSQHREPQAPSPALLDLAAAAEEREITTYRGRFVVSRRQADVSVWRLAADTATAVAAALDRAGVQYFAMHPPYARVARWGVRRDQFTAAMRAMGQTLGEQGFYYCDEDQSRPPRLVTEGLNPAQLESLGGLTVFQYVRCTTTQRLYGLPDGCRIAVWDHSPGRPTLVAPERGGTVQEIEDHHPLTVATRQRWDCWSEPIIASTAGDAAAIEFPVDAVYLWVDDSDTTWRAKRAAVRARLGLDTSTGQADGALASHNFRDRGELRASMRSLEMYAPWIRHIYLVTDDQCPPWLDAQHGRVTVVDHTEIFAAPDALPTYNSHAIGSQIHRIPGLSDHYLLINDDVMFNSPVTPYDFFTPIGQLKISFSRSRRPDIAREHQSPLEQARTNSAELIGRRASELFAHVPIPQRRDIATEVAERYAQEIAATVNSPFRSATDVESNSWLHLYTALFTGRGTRSTMRFGYYGTGDPEVRARLDGSAPSPRIKVICLNDVPPTGGEEDADPQWLAAWLDRRFPIRTPFETPTMQHLAEQTEQEGVAGAGHPVGGERS